MARTGYGSRSSSSSSSSSSYSSSYSYSSSSSRSSSGGSMSPFNCFLLSCCLLIVTCIALIFSFAPYSTTVDLHLADNEQFAMTARSLYSGITIESVSLPALTQTVIALYAALPPTITVPRVEAQALTVSRHRFVFYAFNMLPQSTIDVTWSFVGGATSAAGFFVFIGSHFEHWKNDDGGLSSRPYHQTVGFQGTYQYVFDSADDVFFVWENPNDVQIQGSANFSISAVQYNWRNATPEFTCRLYPCHLDLEGNKCVIMNGLDTNQTNNERTISYRNIGRVGIYFGIAFGVPAGLIVVCVLVCLAVRFKNKRSQYTAIGDDRRPFRTIPQYSPPTYESVAGVTPGAEPAPPAQSPEFDDGPTPSAPPA